jgi:hypothetical protein
VESQPVQCDEVWCFWYAKDKNLPDEMRGEPGVGSIWTWTAIDADTKLMIGWKLGARDAATRTLSRRERGRRAGRSRLPSLPTCHGAFARAHVRFARAQVGVASSGVEEDAAEVAVREGVAGRVLLGASA